MKKAPDIKPGTFGDTLMLFRKIQTLIHASGTSSLAKPLYDTCMGKAIVFFTLLSRLLQNNPPFKSYTRCIRHFNWASYLSSSSLSMSNPGR